MADVQGEAWADETVEAWLPRDGLVFVFRWVPEFAPFNGRRQEHPTFDEWLDDMRSAAVGLIEPSPAVRDVYDMPHYGIGGHRPMTAAERTAHATELQGKITYAKSALEALEAQGEPS